MPSAKSILWNCYWASYQKNVTPSSRSRENMHKKKTRRWYTGHREEYYVNNNEKSFGEGRSIANVHKPQRQGNVHHNHGEKQRPGSYNSAGYKAQVYSNSRSLPPANRGEDQDRFHSWWWYRQCFEHSRRGRHRLCFDLAIPHWNEKAGARNCQQQSGSEGQLSGCHYPVQNSQVNRKLQMPSRSCWNVRLSLPCARHKLTLPMTSTSSWCERVKFFAVSEPFLNLPSCESCSGWNLQNAYTLALLCAVLYIQNVARGSRKNVRLTMG